MSIDEMAIWVYGMIGIGSFLGNRVLGGSQDEKKGSRDAFDAFMGAVVSGLFWPVVLGMAMWLKGEDE